VSFELHSNIDREFFADDQDLALGNRDRSDIELAPNQWLTPARPPSVYSEE
jgi:hypothetical protein